MTPGLQVLVVEDEHRTGQAIEAVLRAAGYTRVTVVASAQGLRARLDRSVPDLVLLDLRLPDGDGAELIPAIHARAPRARVVVLTSATSADRLLAALQAGADGYLYKDDLDRHLVLAIGDALNGGTPLSAAAAKLVIQHLPFDADRAAAPRLTPKEAAVLELLAIGHGYREIARELGVELNTVRTHIRSLYQKIGVENRAEAVNLGWRLGLLLQRR